MTNRQRIVVSRPNPAILNRWDVFIAGRKTIIGYFEPAPGNSIRAYSSRTGKSSLVNSRVAALKFVKDEMYSVWKIKP